MDDFHQSRDDRLGGCPRVVEIVPSDSGRSFAESTEAEGTANAA
jgi:hypothetical protein